MGGNASTLAVINSLRPSTGSTKNGAITAHLVALAWTPLGIALGEGRQAVQIQLSDLFDWVDRTFPASDEHAFVAPLRELELLARIGWDSKLPQRLDGSNVLNVEDLPEDIAEAISRASVALVQCAACRRLCVRDDFAWKEKQLCAWDYHAQVFGKRGPWRTGPYEVRHLANLPFCAYLVPELVAEMQVDIVVTVDRLPETTVTAIVNAALETAPSRAHLAVRTSSGLAILREA